MSKFQPGAGAIEPRPIDRVRADLGEGPNWDETRNALRFVDITQRLIHFYEPAERLLSSVELPQEVGAVIPRQEGGLVAAVRDGVAEVSEETGGFTLIVPIEADIPTNRMNDAKCDSRGRLWAGTMAFDATPGAGSLYRYEPSAGVTRVIEGVTISNGLGWSIDDTTMYYVDSAAGVDAYDFDLPSGHISNPRRLITIDPDVGLPDGLTVDADGYIWVAIWGGGTVHRYTPSGDLESEIRLPVSQVTSLAFGGPEFADLYITTASTGLTAIQRQQEPLAGACFVCRPGVKGLASNRFAG